MARVAALMFAIGLVVGCAKPGAPAAGSSPNEKPPEDPNVKQMKPLEEWRGETSEPDWDKVAPASRLITNKADFEKVWNVWWREGKVPAVDFSTSFVAVHIWSPKAAKPVEHMMGVSISLLKVSPDGTAVTVYAPYLWDDGPGVKWVETKGFYWGLAVFPRAGVKQVNGQPLPPP